jgi:outer membrane protein TolC
VEKPLIKQSSLIGISLLLASCAYFANHNPPDTSSVPSSWNNQDKLYSVSESSLPYLAWWEKFNDPILNQLIESGLAHNNTLRASMANVEAAQGELKRVELNWIPSLSTNVGYSSFPDLGFPGVLFAVIPTYTINLFSQVKEQKRAKYELEAAKAEDDGVRLAVIGQISNSYFTLISQTEQLKLFKQLDSDLGEVVEIANSMYKGGLTPETDVDNAKSELKLIKAQELVIQQNIVASQNALRYLINENPSKIKLTRQFSDLDGNQIIIGNLPLTVIENRPDMVRATYELKASNEGIGIAFSNLMPTIQLSAARGEIGTVANGYDYGQPIYFNQALLEIPIFNASVYGQLDKAKGLNKASYYRYTDTLRKVLLEVNNDLSAHDLYSKRYATTVEAKNDTQKAYARNNSLYKKNIISYMQLLQSKIKLDNLEILVNKSKAEQFVTIVNLYQDLAGGYNHDKESEAKS